MWCAFCGMGPGECACFRRGRWAYPEKQFAGLHCEVDAPKHIRHSLTAGVISRTNSVTNAISTTCATSETAAVKLYAFSSANASLGFESHRLAGKLQPRRAMRSRLDEISNSMGGRRAAGHDRRIEREDSRAVHFCTASGELESDG